MTAGGVPQKASRTAADKGAWDRVSVTGLEADLAYFQARLEFIGEPATVNQKAQLDTFRLLTDSMNRMLARLRYKAPPS
jgi:hypothetical protein